MGARHLRQGPARTCVRSVLVVAGCLVALCAGAVDLPQHRSVPGGVAVLDLGASGEPPQASLGGVPVLVVGDTARWTAVVGIALDAKPGTGHLVVRRTGAADVQQSFVIDPVRYAEQKLTVPPGKVDLSKTDIARYERERAHLAEVAATLSDTAPASLRLHQPTAGPRSSSFGLRRVFNGQPRNPHSGMDIAAAAGIARRRRGGRPRDRHRRLLLQRQDGLARPWPRPADDVLPPQRHQRQAGRPTGRG